MIYCDDGYFAIQIFENFIQIVTYTPALMDGITTVPFIHVDNRDYITGTLANNTGFRQFYYITNPNNVTYIDYTLSMGKGDAGTLLLEAIVTSDLIFMLESLANST